MLLTSVLLFPVATSWQAEESARHDGKLPLTLTPGGLDHEVDAIIKSAGAYRSGASAVHPAFPALSHAHAHSAGVAHALEQLRVGATNLEGLEPPSTVVESIQRLRAAAEETIAEADRALQSLGVAVTAGGMQAEAVSRLNLPQADSVASSQQQQLSAAPLEGKDGYSNFQPFPQPWNCDCYHCGKDTPVDTQIAHHPELTFENHGQCQPLCAVGEVCGPETGPGNGGCYTRASAPCNCATRTVVFVEQSTCNCYPCGSSEPRDGYYGAHANMTNGGSEHCEPLCLVGPTCSATKGSLLDGCYTKALSPCDCSHRKTIMT